MLELRVNTITVEEYLKLRDRVGWKKLSREQAQKALENSLITVGAYLADQPIGMGRIVGDGAVVCYVQDLIIPPQAQRLGVGTMILNRLEEFVEQLRLPGTEMMFDLMCAKGREPILYTTWISCPSNGNVRTWDDQIFERRLREGCYNTKGNPGRLFLCYNILFVREKLWIQFPDSSYTNIDLTNFIPSRKIHNSSFTETEYTLKFSYSFSGIFAEIPRRSDGWNGSIDIRNG